jgi:Rrf2 family protein
MKISTKSRYGLRATAYLAKAGKICPLKKVSQSENISAPYLEKIFSELGKAGLIKAQRGAGGGYCLALAPEEISVGQIVRALDGPLAPADCLLEGKNGKSSCPRSDLCPAKNVWKKVQDSLNSTLDSISLAGLSGG